MEAGQTLMQVEKQKRTWFTRILSIILSFPVLAVGIGLLYFASVEPDIVYLFLYATLGLVVTLFGFMLLLQSPPGGGKKKYVTSGEIAIKIEEEAKEAPEVPANQCPHCGAEIISAGKFCGACGKGIGQAPSE
jgi:YgiT-type zinc finger domain-containing protein